MAEMINTPPGRSAATTAGRSSCPGNEKHCCWVKGKECMFVIRDYTDESGVFRKVACALRAELGDWDAVLDDPRWKENIEGSWAEGINCRDWPEGPAHRRGCNICGACM